ncbi:hypothetical protein U0070_014215 [Myodes glareolus]|uniref:Uncharacterized protein n=1 Tax=Myodes glareolus TaxID=447135 RepID=A0AAW0IP61_MYOGA
MELLAEKMENQRKEHRPWAAALAALQRTPRYLESNCSTFPSSPLAFQCTSTLWGKELTLMDVGSACSRDPELCLSSKSFSLGMRFLSNLLCFQLLTPQQGREPGKQFGSLRRRKELIHKQPRCSVAPCFGHPQLTPAAMKQVALMVDGEVPIRRDCHSGIVNSLGRSASCTWRAFHP